MRTDPFTDPFTGGISEYFGLAVVKNQPLHPIMPGPGRVEQQRSLLEAARRERPFTTKKEEAALASS